MKSHNCGHCNTEGFLQQILEAGVPMVCPSCGLIYSVAKRISSSSEIPTPFRNLAGVACGVLLLFGAALFVDDLLDL
jgi:hypothetical protein